MPSLRKLGRRLRSLVFRRRLDRDLDEELRFHLEMETEALREEGLDDAEARRQARLAFGGLEAVREAARDARGLRPLDDAVRDLGHGLRTLRRRPGFTAAILLTLALGIGGVSTIFGAVRGILLAPLPYPQADRVLTLWQDDRDRGEPTQEVSPANFLDWRDRARSFRTLTAMEPYGLDWEGPEGPLYLPTWLVYEGFFETFGTAPLLGRTFRPEEYTEGKSDVVVLGHRLWQQRFGGDAGVVGRVETLDGRPCTVVGVMPPSFEQPSADVVWAPKILEGWEVRNRGGGFYSVVGRLADGITPAAAQAELDAIALSLEQEHPQANGNVGIRAVSLEERILGGVRRSLVLLLGAVALVFAVAVASVANLQLARAASRGREFALRKALGAGRGRLARQLLAEGLVLAVLGTGIGFAVARVAIPALRAVAPPAVPRLEGLAADGWVFGFAALTSLLATLSTALAPLLVARRRPDLAAGSRGGAGGRFLTRSQGSLVVAQLALSLVLLVGAGLLLRSFVSLLEEDRGFRSEGVAVVTVQSWNYYPTPAERADFVLRATASLRALPGVRAAGMTSSVPLQESIGAEETVVDVEGFSLATPSGELPPVHFSAVTGGFFEALGIRKLEGRLVEDSDTSGRPPVAVVNEAFASRYLPPGSPLGRRIVLGGGERAVSREVVGVVADVRRHALSERAWPGVYVPHGQAPTGANAFVVHTGGSARPALAEVRRTLWGLQPAMAIYREATMEELVGGSVRERRFVLALVACFALMAVALAASGIFGLVSYSTARRTREIGVRMAFGADRAAVIGLVLAQTGRLAALGLALGTLAALAGSRLLEGMLYRVTAIDPIAFVSAAFLLLAVVLAATWIPAHRAARTDPTTALRAE